MSLETFDWVLARGTGITAVVLLTATVALGLVLSLKLTSPAWPRLVTTQAHRVLTALALGTTGLHVLLVVFDTEAGFSLGDALIPFAAAYRPTATALGIVCLYLVVAVWLTTLLRDRIGYRRWRRLHMLAFVAYATAMLHGILAGTDTGAVWTTGLYLGSSVLVGGLLVGRIARARRWASRPAAPPSPPATGGLTPLAPRPLGGAMRHNLRS